MNSALEQYGLIYLPIIQNNLVEQAFQESLQFSEDPSASIIDPKKESGLYGLAKEFVENKFEELGFDAKIICYDTCMIELVDKRTDQKDFKYYRLARLT